MTFSKITCVILLTMVAMVAVSFAAVLNRLTAAGKGSLTSRAIKNGRTLKRDFAFNAYIDQDGMVAGNAILVNPEFGGADLNEPFQLEMNISCMNVVGNVVFFGGMTRKTNDPDLVDAAYFSVKSDEHGDSISQVYFFDDDPDTTGDPQLCIGNRIGDFPMEPLESGDIDIQQ